MKTIKTLLIIVIFNLFYSCSTATNIEVTNETDYNKYLKNPINITEILAERELVFWENKIIKNPNQYPYLSKIADANMLLFSSKGTITYLLEAEKKLIEVNKKTNYNNSGNLRALARNYISQHRFKEALALVKKATVIGENLRGSQKMLFDIYLELGNTQKAFEFLAKIEDYADFDYLIRVSKWYDHKGNLSSAIRFMEKAMKKAEEANNKQLKIWSYTNLADFYGHDGQIKESYNLYLKALALDENNAYAKKGIAWIVYSNDQKPTEAKRILDMISTRHFSPDYYLLKAEIAEYQNDSISKNNNINSYLSTIKNNQYGVMYHQNLAKVYLDEYNNTAKALPLINEEIVNRPTPQSYDLLAWYYFKKKKIKKSLKIVDTYIANKTFEPEIQYHMAEIYKANGKISKAKKIRKELLKSSFELGPLMTKKILNI
ncbi:cell surface protein [Tenacibaculum soleae]|uniref:Cell surface protein n=1 Tax=Tenacibaculum soleae TaxID=447689 RepID=A0A1B9XY43_9FLAO|nr:cell surface protein [Tenacibaculum soleae]OCK42488.1 cell surface protein [Tenacibaculum soleae]